MSRAKLFAAGILLIGALLLGALGTAAQAPDPQATWVALAQPTFDPQKVASVSNVVLDRDLARLILREGTIAFAQPINGRVLIAAFRGRGTLSFAPKLPLEVQQLKFHTGWTELQAEFTEAVFMFSDSTYDDIARQVQFAPGDAASLQKLYADRNDRLTYYGLNWEPRLLHAALSADPKPYAFFHAELNTSRYGWLLLDFDSAELEEVQLARWDQEFEWLTLWCRFPAGGRSPVQAFQQPLARDAYRIQSYKLDITVEKNADLSGSAEVKLTSRQPGQRVLLLTLDPNLRVSAASDAAGNALPFFQPLEPKDRFNFYGRYLVVVLPAPTAPEQQLALKFTYVGKRVVLKEGSGVYFAQSYGWYPAYGLGKETLHNPDFILRFDFDLTLRVPKKFTAVAVGNKTEEEDEGDYHITHWVTDVPVAVTGFSFGDYTVRTGKAQDTAVEVYVNKEPDKYLKNIKQLAQTGGGETGDPNRPIDPTQLGGIGVSPELGILETLSPRRLAPEMVTAITNSLSVFEKYFGPYPYKKLAVANIPFPYGQGWPSLLYVSSLTFLDPTQRFTLFGLRPQQQSEISDRFRAHETSHQWWGHAVGWKSYHDQWLSEGFAEFSGMLYAQYSRGREDYLEALRTDKLPLINADRYGAQVDQIGPIYLGQRLSSPKHSFTYQSIVYNKGGWVLHMLRMLLFNPRQKEADAQFMAMMQEFTKTYYNQAASTDDFKRIAEKYMTPAMNVDGRNNLDWFFNEWVYGTGIPHYIVSYTLTPSGQGVLLRGSIKQTGVPPNFIMPVPLYAHAGKRVTRLGWLNVTGAESPFEIEIPFKIDKVTIDEWEDVLCTVEYK